MSTAKAKKIIKEYARVLRDAHYPISAIYLFGSHARGKPHKWSDIDVAIVSNKLKRNFDAHRALLWKLTREVDTRIEPHGFTPKDFNDEANPMAPEIKRTGIRIV